MSGILFPGTHTPAETSSAPCYRLLSELRLSLDSEEYDEESRRWLLAALDKLLACGSADLASLDRRNSPLAPKFLDALTPPLTDPAQFVQKLQRLRDRLAHRMPFAMLANEIRIDLQRMLNQAPSHSADDLP